MSSLENPPPHALFVRWGKFQAGAFGWPAVLALAVIVGVVGLVLLR